MFFIVILLMNVFHVQETLFKGRLTCFVSLSDCLFYSVYPLLFQEVLHMTFSCSCLKHLTGLYVEPLMRIECYFPMLNFLAEKCLNIFFLKVYFFEDNFAKGISIIYVIVSEVSCDYYTWTHTIFLTERQRLF